MRTRLSRILLIVILGVDGPCGSGVAAEGHAIPGGLPTGHHGDDHREGVGTRFISAGISRVLFNGTPVLVQRWNPDVIEVKVLSGAGTRPVEIERWAHRGNPGTCGTVGGRSH